MEQHSQEEAQAWRKPEGEDESWRRSEKENVRREKMHSREKGRNVAKNSVFPMLRGSCRSKSRLAEAAGAQPAGQTRDENLHAVVARSKSGRKK